MNKNLLWKMLLIVFLAALAVWNVYPPSEKIKQGLDLAGGTSLIYEIDTSDLEPQDRRDLAKNMIPILLKRIDPTHVANIVMRPQGDTRIEIQLPVASLDTRNKRAAYEKALMELENTNINLLGVKQALSMESAQRQAKLDQYAQNAEERKAVLASLAQVYDARKAKQDQRDQLNAAVESARQAIAQAGLSTDSLTSTTAQWLGLETDKQATQIAEYLKNNLPAADAAKIEQVKGLLAEYMSQFKAWSDVMAELTNPVDGLNRQWDKAIAEMSSLNINIDTLRQILDMPAGSPQRKAKLDELKKQFPSRVSSLEAVTSAYDAYLKIGGRLDDPEDLKRMLKGSGVLEFRILPMGNESGLEATAYVQSLETKGPKAASDNRYVWCEIETPDTWQGGITGSFGDKKYVLASNGDNETLLRKAKGWKLKRAYPTVDGNTGKRAIGFNFDEIGANLFYKLTSANLEKPLCILLDDRALSAPRINSAIYASGIITGNFSQNEIADMVNKLNAGSFPARLSELPISEKTIGPAIGADNRDQGIKAGYYAVITVAVFMIFYYMVAGGVADVALFLNILFVLAIMAAFRATFTLSGIAGFILTIGMSVDANVLIFERLREEQKRGSSLKAAIANGYARAFRTIFDSNITTFFTAAILYFVASEEIKGFAIVLMIGIASSMFTALFVTRLILDFLTSRRILTGNLKMMECFGWINVDWMKLRPVFVVVSAALIIGGMAVFFTRNEAKNSKYDIEFTGGTSVQIDLKESARLDRAAVEQKFADYARSIGNKTLEAAKVYAVGDSGQQYEITTTETNRATATITFNQAGQTVQEITDKIKKAEDEQNFVLRKLTITPKDEKTFGISTSRVSVAMIKTVLNNAFAGEAVVSDPVVDEIVGNAVHESLGQFMAVRESLQPQIVASEKIADTTELADYLGGVKILCKLGVPTTAADLEARIGEIRFKPDMQSLKWYKYAVLNEQLGRFEPQETVTQFVFVSSHPEAGYRELSETEWNSYVENETTKLTAAASIESTLSRVTLIDASIGEQAKTRALIAIILSMLGILAYIWVRFGTMRYGVAAIVPLFHDVLITLGIITACTYIAPSAFGKALLIGDFKINLEMIAAFLTIIGYSLNDTIVVFDRIRENRGKLALPTAKIINDSINQTLSRTILTSFTTFLAVLVMYIWGGPGLRGFTFAMMIGIIIGSYSSIAIAAPILIMGAKKQTAQED